MIPTPDFAILPLLKATWETFYMVFIASFLSIIFGLAIGIGLFLTRDQQERGHKGIYQTVGFIVNVIRSIPFIILMISILPLTRLLVGTTIGTDAAIVPLTLAAIPFFARICENALAEIPGSMIETAHALGMTQGQLISKVLLPESLPALIRGGTLTVIGLIGYSAMAGAVGGGGLGELAINYGYQRFNVLVTIETVVLLVVIVQAIQWLGDWLATRRRLKPLVGLTLFLALLCIAGRAWPTAGSAAETLRVGVMSGWPQQVMQVAQQEAWARYHLQIKTIAFDDYILPNTALANGDIDANIFQHVPYLQTQIKAHGYKLVAVAKTFVYPMGFYSRKISSIAQLKNNAIVALPNDPSNEARSLLLLQKYGLITLKPHAGATATVRDIVHNPRQLQFKLLDAAQLPRVLRDADLVALTNDYVSAAGFTLQQALLKESADSLYANVIVTQAAHAHDSNIAELIAVMHSQPVLAKTEKIFPNGGAIPAYPTTADGGQKKQ